MKRILVIALAVASVSGMAQSRSSFLEVQGIKDVVVTPSNGGLDYLVEVKSNPTFTYNNQVYTITDVFGFWTLSNDVDFQAQQADLDIWKVRSNNAGTGAIAGWFTPPKKDAGLNPGESFKFTFNALNSSAVDQFGFHIRVDGIFPGGGDTGYITAVPEPASLMVLGFGAAAVARLRRKRRAPNK